MGRSSILFELLPKKRITNDDRQTSRFSFSSVTDLIANLLANSGKLPVCEAQQYFIFSRLWKLEVALFFLY